MKAIHFDSLGKEVEAHTVRSATVGFVSWRRLSEVLHKAGELRDFERVSGYQVDDRGLSVRIEITSAGLSSSGDKT